MITSQKHLVLDLINPEYSQMIFNKEHQTIEGDYDYILAEDLLIKAKITDVISYNQLLNVLEVLQDNMSSGKMPCVKIAIFLKDFHIGRDYSSPMIYALLEALDKRCDNLFIWQRDYAGLKKYPAARDIRKLLWKLLKEYNPTAMTIPYNIFNDGINEDLSTKETENLVKSIMSTQHKLERVSIQENRDIKIISGDNDDLAILIVEDFDNVYNYIRKNGIKYLGNILSYKKIILVNAYASFDFTIDKQTMHMIEEVFDRIYFPDFLSDEISGKVSEEMIPINVEIYKTL